MSQRRTFLQRIAAALAMTSVSRAHEHDHAEHSSLSDIERRVRALQSILTQKGYVDAVAMDMLIDRFENKVGPRNGARVVARAWVDESYRQWLREDANAAMASLGYKGFGERLFAVENTGSCHNLVVCTLCSCYPWPVLGLPPTWYKSAPYRARAVKDPRGVLADFGIAIPDSVSIRVWDSTSEMRYLVIPQRPVGTEDLSEEQLAALVTRDSMIGTGWPKTPGLRS